MVKYLKSYFIILNFFISFFYLVTADQNDIFVPRGYVHATSVTVVGRPNFRTEALYAVEQPVYLNASDFTTSSRTLETRIGFAKNALEGVGDVDTDAEGAVKGSGQIFALIGDALVLFGVLLVDAVTGFVSGVGAIGQQDGGAVLAQIHVDLDAGARCFRETPLTATAPVAAVHGGGANGRAHNWDLAYARFNGPSAWYVDGHG